MVTHTLDTLPSEIRTRIYQWLFLDCEVHIHDPKFECTRKTGSRPLTESSLSIILANRTLSQEAHPHFYAFAVLCPCPCFLCRTETEDFILRLDSLAKKHLQPLLTLWELRRTAQSFESRFKLYSRFQQIQFAYTDATGVYAESSLLSVIYLIAHAQKNGLSIWLEFPGISAVDQSRGSSTVNVKVDSTSTVTIVANEEALGNRVCEFLLATRCWALASDFDFPAEHRKVLDEHGTRFEIIVRDTPEKGWAERYHFECMSGRKAAIKIFGRHA